MSINETVENKIIEVLKLNFSDFDVESFPANFENYNFTSSKGCMLIKFVNTLYSSQTTVWDVNQDSTVNFEIISCYRSMDNYGQIHKPQQKLKDTLQGLEILGRKIILIKEEFLKEKNTDLYCKLTFKIDIPTP
jgi:hypothetical protein